MARTRRKGKRRKKIHWLSAKQVQDTVKKNWLQIFCTLAVLGGIVFLGISINSFLFASEFFSVSEIEVVDKDPNKIDYPLARIDNDANIFRIDLDKIADSIEHGNYDVQKAIVKRVLPNKLVIEVLRRRPIAQVQITTRKKSKNSYQYFAVNKDAYILSDLGTKKKKALPTITGIGLGLAEIEVGRDYQRENLSSALELLNEVENNRVLKNYNITRIDAADPRVMSFFINNLEVKIGNRNIKQKLENLTGVLASKEIDYSKDYYIDLRFKDIVFGKNQ